MRGDENRRIIVSAHVSSGGLYTHLRNVMPRLLSLRRDWCFEVHAPEQVLRSVFGKTDASWMRCGREGSRLARLCWEFGELPRLLRSSAPPLFWEPFGPFWNIALARNAVVRLENLLALLRPVELLTSRADRRRLRILRHVYLANARRALRPVCASLHSRARYVDLTGLPPEHFDVIPHGVDVERIQETTPSPTIREVCRAGPFVLTVGQAIPYRLTRELILGYRILAERLGPSLPRLVWAGAARREDRGYERECLALLGPLVRRGAAIHLGQVSHFDVHALGRAATLFVHPSVHEDCPNTILEAFAAGAPVICADIPANREIGDGAAHFVSEPTPAKVATAIEELLADPARLSSLGRAGSARARRYSWDETARRLVDTFERAFAVRSAAGG